MPNYSNTDVVPLTGADCFLRAIDSEARRSGQAGHLSQLVLRLGPAFDVDRFRRLIEEVSRANPIVRSPIRRQAVVGPPVYRLDRAVPPPGVSINLHSLAAVVAANDSEAPALGAIPDLFCRRLNDRLDATHGRLLCFDLVPRGGVHPGTDLAMTWQHMLFDGSGSELFVEHLAACSSDPSRGRELPINRAAGGKSSSAVAELAATAGERGQMAQAWNTYMHGVAAKRPTSLAGPLRQAQQDLRYDQVRLEGSDAVNAIDRAKKMAGFLTPMLFFLAVSLRAHQAVADLRGRSSTSWIVPLPVDLRPKGGQGEVFRTHVSLLWFQVTTDETRDLAGLIEVLKVQRLSAIRAKLVEAGVAALDFARYAPARLYSHMARRTFGGELGSFFFAYTGEFAPAAESLCGATILDAFHAPSVPASPGSALVFSRRGGGLSAVHVYQRDSVDPADLGVLREQLRRDLGVQ